MHDGDDIPILPQMRKGAAAAPNLPAKKHLSQSCTAPPSKHSSEPLRDCDFLHNASSKLSLRAGASRSRHIGLGAVALELARCCGNCAWHQVKSVCAGKNDFTPLMT